MNPLFVKGSQFFEEIRPAYKAGLKLVVVSHVLDSAPGYLKTLSAMAEVAMLLPKPRSIDQDILARLQPHYNVAVKSRQQLASAEVVAAIVNDVAPEGELILVDIGGYFAAALPQLTDRLRARLLGIVEVTENGHQRYAALPELPVPVISLARSPLKGPEDYLTGQSIVYSAEALMRQCHHIMNGGHAVVFGYGKIGSSIAKALHAKNVNTKVVELNPIRAIEAMSRGFELIDKEAALQSSDVIFCATGNQSLANHDFARIKNGAFIFSVTSSDDELDLSKAEQNFAVKPVTDHIARYERLGQYFYLANSGNAINFIHNAEVGPYIYLVQGEVIRAIEYVSGGHSLTGLSGLPETVRLDLARHWLDVFKH